MKIFTYYRNEVLPGGKVQKFQLEQVTSCVAVDDFMETTQTAGLSAGCKITWS